MGVLLRLALATLVAAGCGPAGDDAAEAPEVLCPAPIAAPTEGFPEVAALYRANHRSADGRVESWELTLHRGAARVETHESRGGTGEAWTRDAAGNVTSHEKLFHRHRRGIEYHASDLRALGALRSWEEVAGMVDPHRLEYARRAGRTQVAGHEAVAYVEERDGGRTEVLWVPSLHLPARVRQVRGKEVLEMRLAELHPLSGGSLPSPETADYRWRDYADVGDSHGDEFLERLANGFHHTGHEVHGH